MRIARYMVVAAVLAAGAGGAWWWYARPDAVSVVTPARGSAADVVYATGVVEPRRWAKVTSIVRERIVEMCRCEGDSVKAGDVLGKLDDSGARATLAELEARADFAQAERERAEGLIERRIISRQAYDRALNDVQRAVALVAAQKAQLDNYELRAPLDGVVLRRDGEVGEVAEPGTVLFWVGEPSPLQIVSEVNEEDIPKVVVGQQAWLRADAFPDNRLGATVSRITPKGDPVLKTYRVYLDQPEDTPLLIGMSVDVNIITRTKQDVLLVPLAAVNGDRIFVVGSDGRLEERSLRIGIRGTETVEVLEGVEDGTRIVSPLIQGLKAGQKVRVEAPEPG
ncbi:efflux RND transporter periplasmic adaptor subunit [Breoghania sp. L-A4]|uniref:efflux RND transporter periplasmic adaptor subunit n=1 Tax=Breoghania sp. L-A4 TaxID=2304600 RepID=UPI000E35E352|nr:efflux RND transporter periplasmic adaptor subunit [Breoghania sp. L-A4]AXS39435.1 efflux RND transporter periplasmic adaptor subunit [Breoghania sp. L-A4]